MLNQKDFMRKIYEKSNQISENDSFYSTKVYENEKKFTPYKMVANFAIAFVLLSAAGAIAYTTYQTITKEKSNPQYNWTDGSVKFNEKYEDYIEPVGEIIGVHNDTTLELVSQNYDGGIAVLEFYLKLSEEDKAYLKVGESTFTSSEIESYRESFNGFADERINSYDPNLSEEKNQEIHEKWTREKEEYTEELERMSSEKNSVSLNLNAKPGEWYTYELDGEKISLQNSKRQDVEKLGESEYRIYQMYFIPDELLPDKEIFTLGFHNLFLSGAADREKLLEIYSDIPEYSGYGGRMDFESLELTGEFSVTFQNNNQTEYLEFENKTISYNILQENIEYIKKTPMQTIIKMKANLEGIREYTLALRADMREHPDYIGNIDFHVYNGEEKVGALIVETKRDVWYEDGKYVEWEPYQFSPYWWDGYSPIGGRMEITTYIIISNEDCQGNLKIVPTISKEAEDTKIYQSELEDAFEINF